MRFESWYEDSGDLGGLEYEFLRLVRVCDERWVLVEGELFGRGVFTREGKFRAVL